MEGTLQEPIFQSDRFENSTWFLSSGTKYFSQDTNFEHLISKASEAKKGKASTLKIVGSSINGVSSVDFMDFMNIYDVSGMFMI